MHPDDHPISNPVTDPLNWLELICDLLQRFPDMLSTNQLLVVLALLLVTCLYFVLAASWAHRSAESCRINKRFDDADERSERLEKMFRPLEHVPKRMNDVEHKQDELNSRIDTVVTVVDDLQDKLHEKSKDDTPASESVPTQDVGLAGSLAAIEGKVDQLINDQANNATHQEYSEQAAKLIAVERKIDQLLEHLLAPPPPAPRLTTSSLRALDSEPVLPVVQPLTLSGGKVTATTTPIIPPTPSLSVSVVAGQTLAPVEVSAAHIGLSSCTSTSTEPEDQSEDCVLASTGTQTEQADAIQELSVSGIFCQSTAPVYQVPTMAIGGISAVITEPIEPFDATWVLNEQIEEMTGEHEVMRNELFQAQVQAKNAQKLKDTAEDSAAKLAMEKVHLQEDLFQAKSKLAVAKEEHDTTRNKLVEVQKQVEDVQQLKTAAENSVVNLAEEKSQLQEDLSQANRKLAAAKEEHDTTRNELVKVQKQVGDVKTTAEISVTALAEEKSQLQHELAQKESELRDAQESITELENDKVILTSEKSQLQHEVAHKKNELQDAQEIFAELEDDKATLESEKSQLQHEVAHKESELQDAQESIDELENDKATLDSQFCGMMDDLDAQKKLTAQTKATLEEVKTDLAITTEKLNGVQMEVDCLTVELDENNAIFLRMADAGIDVLRFMNTDDEPIEDPFVDFEHDLDCDDYDIASPAQENKAIERPAVEVTSSIVAGLNAGASVFAPSSYAPHIPAVDETMKSETAKDAMHTGGAAPEVTSRFQAGLEESTDATTGSKIAEKEEAHGAIVREETPVTKKVGLGKSRYAPTTPPGALGTSVTPPVQHETALKVVQGLEKTEIRKTGEDTAIGVPNKIKPNLGLSKYAPKAPAAASVPPPATEELSIKPVKEAEKVATPGKGEELVAKGQPTFKVGLGVSKYASKSPAVAPTLPPLPTTSSPLAKEGTATKPITQAEKTEQAELANPSKELLDLIVGGAVKTKEYKEMKYCNICKMDVEVDVVEEIPIEKEGVDVHASKIPPKKEYFWDVHERDFHERCPDCKMTVLAPYDSTLGKNDFTAHKKVCAKRRVPTTSTQMTPRNSSSTPSSPTTKTGSGRQEREAQLTPADTTGLERCSKCSSWLPNSDRGAFLSHCKNCPDRICNHQGCGDVMHAGYFFDVHRHACKSRRTHEREAYAMRNQPGGSTYQRLPTSATTKTPSKDTTTEKQHPHHDAEKIPALTGENNTTNTAKTALATQSTATSAPTEDTTAKKRTSSPQFKVTKSTTPRRPPKPVPATIWTPEKKRPSMVAGAIADTPAFTGKVFNYQQEYTAAPSTPAAPTPTPTLTPTAVAEQKAAQSERPPMPKFGTREEQKKRADGAAGAGADGNEPQWEGNVILY
jgi:predicted  nucleic acid-binding Zn-ribbon protein